jgi:hypothetical protein
MKTMNDDKIRRNDLYIFQEEDSAYKVIKAILLDFFTSGFQSSNYVMNGQFSPESREEMEFVLQSLQSDFEDLFARNFNTIIRELSSRTNHIDKMDLKKKYLREVEESDKIKEINKRSENGKVLTVCPRCQKKIYAIDIDESKIKRFPMSYIDVHSHENHPEHALLIYIDAQGKCRGRGNIDVVTIEKERSEQEHLVV